MRLKNAVEEYLKTEPKFRERKNKDRGIVNILMGRHAKLADAIRQGFLTKEYFTELMQEYASMDRAWRQALEHDSSLRGTDYDDKKVLEQKKQIELGYTPGYDSDIKKLKTL